MNPKIDTYCQVRFLENFFESVPHVSFSDMIAGEENIKLFLEMSNMIYSKAKLSVDDLPYILSTAKNGNPFFKKLIKSSTSGGSVLIDYSKSFRELLINFKVALSTPNNSIHMYFDDDAVLLNSMSGRCTMSINNWKSFINKLSINKTIKVDSYYQINQFKGWEVLSNIGLPINAAVIADNYLLHNPGAYRYNIQQILKNLLPQKLENVDFDLAIITKKDLPEPQEKLQILNLIIKEFKVPYNVNITIYCSPTNRLHDRDIITNYYRIHSGHSLDYYNFEGKITRKTTLSIVGINGGEDNPHHRILKNFIDIAAFAKSCKLMYGCGKNRLLTNGLKNGT